MYMLKELILLVMKVYTCIINALIIIACTCTYTCTCDIYKPKFTERYKIIGSKIKCMYANYLWDNWFDKTTTFCRSNIMEFSHTTLTVLTRHVPTGWGLSTVLAMWKNRIWWLFSTMARSTIARSDLCILVMNYWCGMEKNMLKIWEYQSSYQVHVHVATCTCT